MSLLSWKWLVLHWQSTVSDLFALTLCRCFYHCLWLACCIASLMPAAMILGFLELQHADGMMMRDPVA